MKINKETKILIIGLGLIGGSYAIGLKNKGYEVGGIDISKKTIDYALEKGIISSGQTFASKEYVSQFDLIIFAVYPKVITAWLKENQDYIKTGAIITDVIGVKSSVVEEVQNILRSDLEFVGAHPMAGKENSGIENASDKIFGGANYIVTPTEKNTEKAVEKVKALGETLGFKKISELSPKIHDEMIGFLSQLTHCIAVSLMTCKDSDKLVDYTGDSFRDLTRIAKINEEMWSELFILNKENLLEQMDLFLDKFSELKKTIVDSDTEKMKEIMRISTARRKLFDR